MNAIPKLNQQTRPNLQLPKQRIFLDHWDDVCLPFESCLRLFLYPYIFLALKPTTKTRSNCCYIYINIYRIRDKFHQLFDLPSWIAKSVHTSNRTTILYVLGLVFDDDGGECVECDMLPQVMARTCTWRWYYDFNLKFSFRLLASCGKVDWRRGERAKTLVPSGRNLLDLKIR